MLKISGPLASIPLLCIHNPPLSSLDRMSQLLPTSMNDWENWIKCIKQNQIESQIFIGINKLKINIPNWVLNELENSYQLYQLKCRLKKEQTCKMLEKFSDENLYCIILNGYWNKEDIITDFSFRSPSRIDLLIQPEDREKIFRIFNKMNFKQIDSYNYSNNDSSHFFPYWPIHYNQTFDLLINTQWNLYSRKTNTKKNSSTDSYKTQSVENDYHVWNRAVKNQNIPSSQFALSKTDQVLYLCHAINRYEIGVGELCALYNNVVNWSKNDWIQLEKSTLDSIHCDTLFRVFSLIQNVFYSESIQLFLNAIENRVNEKIKKEIEFRTLHADELLITRTTVISDFYKYHAAFNLSSKLTQKIKFFFKMIQNFIIPNNKLTPKLYFKSHIANKFEMTLKSVTIPFKIFTELANEINWRGVGQIILMDLRQLLKFCFNPLSWKKVNSNENYNDSNVTQLLSKL